MARYTAVDLQADCEPPNGIAAQSVPVRPFLKWAGGKQWLAPLAPLILPPGFSGTYYEPFVGGRLDVLCRATPKGSPF